MRQSKRTPESKKLDWIGGHQIKQKAVGGEKQKGDFLKSKPSGVGITACSRVG